MESGKPEHTEEQEEQRKAKHLLADWWIYVFFAFFIGGLFFLTYALTLRGDIINDFEKKRSAAPASVYASAQAAPGRTA
ncbi:MAG: hypothetical protein C0522_12790 [Rhodocyclaceae bacterium]|jgi:hypothetical protein|nr:hypothetical protein [Rhodocyclaceae bacterium]